MRPISNSNKLNTARNFTLLSTHLLISFATKFKINVFLCASFYYCEIKINKKNFKLTLISILTKQNFFIVFLLTDSNDALSVVIDDFFVSLAVISAAVFVKDVFDRSLSFGDFAIETVGYNLVGETVGDILSGDTTIVLRICVWYGVYCFRSPAFWLNQNFLED